MGGVDEIRKAEIDFNVRQMAVADESLRHLSVAEYNRVVEARIQQEYERQGLNQNFWARSVRYLWKAITLDLGQAERLTSDSGSSWVRQIILERLFPTLLLFASAQLLIFSWAFCDQPFPAVRRLADRTVIALAYVRSAVVVLRHLSHPVLRCHAEGFPFGSMVRHRRRPIDSVCSERPEAPPLPVLAQVLSSVFTRSTRGEPSSSSTLPRITWRWRRRRGSPRVRSSPGMYCGPRCPVPELYAAFACGPVHRPRNRV